jgi:hypothetical protein
VKTCKVFLTYFSEVSRYQQSKKLCCKCSSTFP